MDVTHVLLSRLETPGDGRGSGGDSEEAQPAVHHRDEAAGVGLTPNIVLGRDTFLS